jgi:transposase
MQSHKEMITCFDVQIERIEKHVENLIKEDRTFKTVQADKYHQRGWPQTAIVMIILTKGFSSFENWRKFASYAGIAPFPNQSGTFNGRTKTSKLANKRIKTLLTMCAGHGNPT